MVESNHASYVAAKSELKEATLGIGTYDALHAMDYMVLHIFSKPRTLQQTAVNETASIRKVSVEMVRPRMPSPPFQPALRWNAVILQALLRSSSLPPIGLEQVPAS